MITDVYISQDVTYGAGGIVMIVMYVKHLAA